LASIEIMGTQQCITSSLRGDMMGDYTSFRAREGVVKQGR